MLTIRTVRLGIMLFTGAVELTISSEQMFILKVLTICLSMIVVFFAMEVFRRLVAREERSSARRAAREETVEDVKAVIERFYDKRHTNSIAWRQSDYYRDDKQD